LTDKWADSLEEVVLLRGRKMKSAWTEKSTRVMLGVVAALLAANLLANVVTTTSRPAVAAGLPDSGAQLQQVVDSLEKLNKTVERLDAYLESGKLTVKLDKPEK
jgi:hypothetical protein